MKLKRPQIKLIFPSFQSLARCCCCWFFFLRRSVLVWTWSSFHCHLLSLLFISLYICISLKWLSLLSRPVNSIILYNNFFYVFSYFIRSKNCSFQVMLTFIWRFTVSMFHRIHRWKITQIKMKWESESNKSKSIKKKNARNKCYEFVSKETKKKYFLFLSHELMS